MMTHVETPGKLYIAGEYAVVESGEPAILAAVDRSIRLRLTKNNSGREVVDESFGHLNLGDASTAGKAADAPAVEGFEHVLSAMAIMETLALEKNIVPIGYRLSIESELSRYDGRKFGLGSSAAIIVGTIEALNQHWGMKLTRLERFKAAAIATHQLNPAGSGGDIAASTYGGWLRYSSFDHVWLQRQLALRPLSDLLAMSWPGLSIQLLKAPSDLRLLIGWTGSPASTVSLVRTVHTNPAYDSLRFRNFIDSSRAVVDDISLGFMEGNISRIQEGIRSARANLNDLTNLLNVELETPMLRFLAMSAQDAGFAGKFSGAGGGDCGIAVASAKDDVSSLLKAWEDNGIEVLDLHVKEL